MKTTLFLIILFMLGCSTAAPVPPLEVPEIRPGLLQGYLDSTVMPDAVRILPPPPAENSPAALAEQAVLAQLRAESSEVRVAKAISDNALSYPAVTGHFECAAGAAISAGLTPHTSVLLRRALVDFGFSTLGAKNHYQRPRPFLVNGEPVCLAGEREHLANSGAYPSGHAAIGWGLALVLSELLPARSTELMVRGRTFGESRLVCNLHWPTDVAAGQQMASVIYARLQADPVFRAQAALAKQELVQAPVPDATRCADEQASLQW